MSPSGWMFMSITCSCQSPVHANHLFMSTTCSCQSPVHVNHLFMSITCSCQSPVHVNHLFMSITCSRQSPVHVNHLFMSITHSPAPPTLHMSLQYYKGNIHFLCIYYYSLNHTSHHLSAVNLHPPQTVGVIRLSWRKEVHPIS